MKIARIIFFSCLLLTISQNVKAQNMTTIDTTYASIPDYPEDYSPGSIISRMIDGLGYRYHWATRDLTPTDLEYKPSEDGITSLETLEHILGLSKSIYNATHGLPNIRSSDQDSLSYEQLRAQTLENLSKASVKVLGKSSEEVSELKVVFQRGEKKSEFPIWNLLNGHLADAIYHVGQIVVFRRASGNPLDPTVNVFMGKNK